jgi:small nuclear ribonucleoprotein (snRNP)-like protein
MKRNKIVVHLSDGTILKGHVNDFRPNKAEFHLETLENEVSLLNVADLKGVFFVKDHDGVEGRQDSYDDVIAGGGRRVKVTFSDGEEMIGYVSSYSPDRTGFFLVPADLGSNNERVFVVASSCKDVEFL